jgi:formylglycine-generating enzyme
MAKVWQGDFPYENQVFDDWEHTSPLRSFPPNPYGLFDMIGNVWERTADWYQDHGALDQACCTITDPRGTTAAGSVDPAAGDGVPRKVLKGGSHLCAPNYCRRYRPAARMPQAVDTSTSHLGSRCVVRP